VSAAVTTIRNVLLVEDNEAWAELTREAFADVDPSIDVRTVSSGQEALALLLGGLTPDLVLLDLNMPGVDGRDVLRALQDERDRRFEVVVLSASVAERDRSLAHQLGASAYCSKPTTFLQLRELVTDLVKTHADDAPAAEPDTGPHVEFTPPPAPTEAEAPAGARIAVVEDSPLDASLITDQLTPAGFVVRTAGSIRAFRDEKLADWADCVLLDLNLPDAAGLEGLRAVVQATDGVPIIVLTGNPSESLTIDALAAGAQDWVRKGSMNADQLARTIRFAIERSRLQAQLSSERERFTAELSRSNADLAGFAQVAAHDLRSPLQAVIGFSELLERRYGSVLDETGREFLEHIVDAAHRMDTLIESLLSYSRVGTAASAVEAVDLGEVLTSVRSALLGEITATGALVRAGNLPTISGDRTQFSQLLQNLVGNAIKFVAPGVVPQIQVSAEREATGWRLDVIDNGIGVPPEQRAQIFEMFNRGDERTDYSGTGVGLAVCQRVMQRRGGHITVDDVPGGGSRFSCFFPDEWDHTLRVGPSLFVPSDGLGLRPSADGESAGPVILLVEDGDDHAALLQGMLEQAGTPVVWKRVADLASARRLLAEDPPDCLLLDLHLPDSSGLDSLEEVRTAAPFVPVVVVTALADEAIALEALRRGAQDYVLKGRVTADALIRTILFAIERQAQELSMVEAALTDALTGLANRRCLADRLTAALGRASRGELPPAVLLVDLDGFKAVNDHHGHRAGDAVLIETAHRLQSAVRGTDTVARLGGDEFVVLCEGLDEAGAAEVVQRIQAALTQPITLDDYQATLGASIGVVVARQNEAADALLDRADEAMYAAKRPGR
jgi:diguanylate cyclase (GGDEF)-like protein